jgi:hypothetical protein
MGINRETVRWYLRLRKSAISIAGSEEGADRKPAISIAGVRAGHRSRCERLTEVIAAQLRGWFQCVPSSSTIATPQASSEGGEAALTALPLNKSCPGPNP